MTNKQTIFILDEQYIYYDDEILESMKIFVANHEIFIVTVMAIILMLFCYSIYTREWMEVLSIFVIISRTYCLWRTNPEILLMLEKL
jgi:hypothetical protein